MTSVRFPTLSDEELKKIIDSKDSLHTKQATKYAIKIFRDYLDANTRETNFENFTPEELDDAYAELRNVKGESYKRSSLLAIRSGNGRHLATVASIDLIKDEHFKKSNSMFVSMCKVVSKQGKGDVDHKKAIEPTDIQKLYSSMVFDQNTPTGLVNKVWFELCLQFCRRGRENQREMTPDMFKFEKDDKGCEYVVQRSESTKNHQGKERQVEEKTARMYATGTSLCPVKSLKLYLQKRNPDCSALFQRPKDSFYMEDNVWYENRPMGKNKLGQMMVTLSKAADLSQIYTNHCVRATAITALSNAGYETRHIMTISGHRNEASVRSYVTDTTTDQKRSISTSLSNIHVASSEENDSPRAGHSDCFNEELDLLSLTASQTENVLLDITNFESSNTSSKLCAQVPNLNTAANVNQSDVIAIPNQGDLSIAKYDQNVRIANTHRPAPVFNFNNCNVNVYNSS